MAKRDADETIAGQTYLQLNQQIADSQRSKLELFTRSALTSSAEADHEPQALVGLQRYQQVASSH